MAEASIDNAFVACAGGPYTIRDGAELMTMPPVAEETLWGGIPVHQHGATAAFFGPPGSHKSRLVLHLAVHQILGRPFAGMAVHPKPLRWLVLNGENCLARLQRDLRGFAKALTAEEIACVGERLAVTSLEQDADGDLMLDERDPAGGGNFLRIAEAVARTNPEVVVVDTLPAVCPDELDAAAIRHALGAVRKATAASANAPVTIIYVGHARPGIKEEAKASGAEALSYQRGNRVLNGILRCVWNVRRCEVVGDEPVDARAACGVREGIELVHAKSNNGELMPPTAVVLDEATFMYRHVADFNHAAWQESLEKMARSNATQSPAAKAAELAAVVESTEARVAAILTKKGPMTLAALVREMQAAGVSSSARNAKELIGMWRESGKLKTHQPKPNRPMRVMTPAQHAEAVG